MDLKLFFERAKVWCKDRGPLEMSVYTSKCKSPSLEPIISIQHWRILAQRHRLRLLVRTSFQLKDRIGEG